MPRSVKLGDCCRDCFDAVNFLPAEIGDDPTRMLEAGRKLAVRAEAEGVGSLHTGEMSGFTWEACTCCGNTEGGMRWELHGHTMRKDVHG